MLDPDEEAAKYPRDLAEAYAFALRHLQLADRAMSHPLGFTMLQQVPDSAGGYSRVHIWRRDAPFGQIPHSHSGHLRSMVLAGRLRNNLWGIDRDIDAPTPIIAVEKRGADHREYRIIGCHGFRLEGVGDFEPGQSYEIPAGVFHSNECLTEICVTFVRRRAGRGETSRVAGKLEEITASQRRPSVLSNTELERLERDLLAAAWSLRVELPRL
ncbi:MAG: hypothetical protein QOJ27_134 [Sphingomonadales bacterium]|nr:hypothetical protein [Sphingomonadales bacterium]